MVVDSIVQVCLDRGSNPLGSTKSFLRKVVDGVEC